MNFIQHTVAWCQGEILEGKIIVIYALILIILSIFILPMTHISNSKFLIIPLLFSAFVFLIVGGLLIFKNPMRMKAYQHSFLENPIEFIKSEKKRTDEFMSWYPKTAWVLIIVFTVALFTLIFIGSSSIRYFCLVILLFCLSGWVIDHFSKARAQIYLNHIHKEIESWNKAQN